MFLESLICFLPVSLFKPTLIGFFCRRHDRGLWVKVTIFLKKCEKVGAFFGHKPLLGLLCKI